MNTSVVISIAGFDPSSGAGVTADVKTAAAWGVTALTCITALTVQSTQGVFAVELVKPELVRETLARLAEDVDIGAIRIGMLGSGATAAVVADFLEELKCNQVVLDPVLRSTSGAELIDKAGVKVIRERLLPLCAVITPNWDEAFVLADEHAAHEELPGSWNAALPLLRSVTERLHELGSAAVVVTGGHLPEANDYLSIRDATGITEEVFKGSRLDSRATHGTGCAFATSVACRLARGASISEAVRDAKEFVRNAIQAAYPIGKGHGPMNHLFRLKDF
jgi:hydroxymethylpyrimidine/phosphomethylpyrimidine kinase